MDRNLVKLSFLLIGFNAACASASEAPASISTPSGHCFATDQIGTLTGSAEQEVKDIYVLARFATDPIWWVQPAATITTDGNWSGPVYFGEINGNYGDYLVQIVVDPNPPIEIGSYGTNTPPARFVSRAVTVTKRPFGNC